MSKQDEQDEKKGPVRGAPKESLLSKNTLKEIAIVVAIALVLVAIVAL